MVAWLQRLSCHVEHNRAAAENIAFVTVKKTEKSGQENIKFDLYDNTYLRFSLSV